MSSAPIASWLTGFGRLVLCHVERTVNTERDTRYMVNLSGRSGSRLMQELAGNRRVSTNTCPNVLDPEDIVDAWYEESAQFNAHTFEAKFASHGFKDISVDTVPIWGQKILFLKARR